MFDSNKQAFEVFFFVFLGGRPGGEGGGGDSQRSTFNTQHSPSILDDSIREVLLSFDKKKFFFWNGKGEEREKTRQLYNYL